MKKKEIFLDFTSLLDIIMILLFVVITSMSKSSLDAKSEADVARESAQNQIGEINSQKDELQSKYDALKDQYDYLKITSDYDPNDVSVYKAALGKMTKVSIICETDTDDIGGNPEVKANIYIDKQDSKEQSMAGSLVIEHKLDLSAEERIAYNATQVTEATKVLSDILQEDENPMIWITVQYLYNDENFSNSDLEILNNAADGLERSFGKSCYVEKIKIY